MDAIEITADELGTEESITSTVEETPSPTSAPAFDPALARAQFLRISPKLRRNSSRSARTASIPHITPDMPISERFWLPSAPH